MNKLLHWLETELIENDDLDTDQELRDQVLDLVHKMREERVTVQKKKILSQEEKDEKKLRKWVKDGLIENAVLFDKDDFEWEFNKVIEELDEYKTDHPDEEIDESVISGIVFDLLDMGHFELDEDEE